VGAGDGRGAHTNTSYSLFSSHRQLYSFRPIANFIESDRQILSHFRAANKVLDETAYRTDCTHRQLIQPQAPAGTVARYSRSLARKNNAGDDETFSIQGYSTSMVNGADGGSCSTHVLTARRPCCRTRIPNDARSWARNHISSSAPAYVCACLQVCASACVGLSLSLSACVYYSVYVCFLQTHSLSHTHTQYTHIIHTHKHTHTRSLTHICRRGYKDAITHTRAHVIRRSLQHPQTIAVMREGAHTQRLTP
jgi:hypothetical protein